MKRLLAFVFALALLLPIGAQAQSFDYKTRQAVASDYNGWTAFSSTTVAAGAATITIEDPRVTIPGGTQINPFQTNSKILVDTGSVQETLTITSSSCTTVTACTVTGTFGSAHSGRYQITSGTYGLQEALDYLTNNGGQGTVVVPPLSSVTTAMITAAVRGATGINVQDRRSGTLAIYGWSGSAYASIESIGATAATYGGTANFNGSASGANTPVQVKGIPQYVFMGAAVSTANGSSTPLTGLSWTIPANTVMNYPFHCELTFNQATAATANAFTITTATQAPTNGTLFGWSSTAATTATRLVTKAYAATTATNIVSVTPTANGTDETVYLDGFIEQPTNAAPAAVSIGVTTTSGGTDITTVARDSWCRLF